MNGYADKVRAMTNVELLIDVGWEFSIRYEGNEWSISVWKPDWPSGYGAAITCPTAKGHSLDAAMLGLIAIL